MTEIFDALGIVMYCEDFIIQEGDSQYITAKPLRRYLWCCIGNVKNMLFDEEEATVMYLDQSFGRRIDNGEIPNRINSALKIANDVVNQILGRGFHDNLNVEFEALLLSIMCLIETLGESGQLGYISKSLQKCHMAIGNRSPLKESVSQSGMV